MSKVYMAHSIATTGEFNHSIETAKKIKALGYEVYALALNNAINDKSNNPTPTDIYNSDVSEILSSDYVVVNVNGGTQDGTVSEIGLVAGLNECGRDIPIIAYTSNKRLLQPQFYQGIASASANHLVLGMIEKWGIFVGSEKEMLGHLSFL